MKKNLSFENAFRDELLISGTNNSMTEDLWSEITARYSRPARHYHTLVHVENLYLELLPLKTDIADWQTLLFSIAYHDIVYNTLRHDNEEKSARLAVKRLSQLKVSEIQKDKCAGQILATKSHSISPDSDTNYLTDADLSILGKNNNDYQVYITQIRKEYKFYPDIVYKPGRKKVLQHFLDMKSIYKTVFFKEKYESQARQNIKNELSALS
jgi:predicted metal-dependent HD superfamily phosphohydrolase